MPASQVYYSHRRGWDTNRIRTTGIQEVRPDRKTMGAETSAVQGVTLGMAARMILSGHQPVYLPSILLFSKIAHSDAFMWVGHCQASPGTWHNRNQIRNAKLVI